MYDVHCCGRMPQSSQIRVAVKALSVMITVLYLFPFPSHRTTADLRYATLIGAASPVPRSLQTNTSRNRKWLSVAVSQKQTSVMAQANNQLREKGLKGLKGLKKSPKIRS